MSKLSARVLPVALSAALAATWLAGASTSPSDVGAVSETPKFVATASVSSFQCRTDGSALVQWKVVSTPGRLATWRVTSPTLRFSLARATTVTRAFTSNAVIPVGSSGATLAATARWSDGSSQAVTGTYSLPYACA